MSSNPVSVVSQPKDDNDNTEIKSADEVIAETMVREVTPTKKCLKEEAHVAFKCCVYGCSFSLNGLEFCCGTLSEFCLAMSKMALCCKAGLEQVDCDNH